MADVDDPKVLTEKQINQILEEREALQSRISARNEEILEAYKGIISQEEEQLVIGKAQLQAQQAALDLAIQAKDLGEEVKNDLVERWANTKGESRTYEDIVAHLKNIVAETKNQQKAGKPVLAQLDASKQAAEYLLGSMLGINSQSKKLGLALKRPGRLFKDMGAHLAKNVSMTNLMGSAALKMAEGFKSALDYVKETYGPLGKPLDIAKDFYDQSRLMARDLGMTSTTELGEFQARTTAISDRTRFTRDELMKTRKELFKSSAAFRQSVPKDQDAAIELSKTLERRLNVATSASAKVMEELQLTFGKTGAEAQRLTANFAFMAKTLKTDVNKLYADFAAQSGNLARFGLPSLENEFLNLAEVQEKTGVSMDKIISSMEKFTTFEGALGAASKLNAVFGSTIDGLELMDITMKEGPLAGFATLRKQMGMTGEEISQMNYAHLRVLSESLGITAQELKKLGNVSVEELERIATNPEKKFQSMSETLKELQKDQKNMETETESVGKTQDELATQIQFLANTMKDFSKNLADVMSKIGAFGSMLVTGGGILLGLGLLAKAFMAIKTAAMGSTAAMAVAGQTAAAAAGASGVAGAAGAAGAAGTMGGVLGGGAITAGAGAALLGPLALAAGLGIVGGMAINEIWDPFNTKSAGGEVKSTTGFAAGQTLIGKDQQAMLHAGEQVIPANQVNPNLSGGAKNTEMNFTINMRSQDGSKLLEQRNIKKSFSAKEDIRAVIEEEFKKISVIGG